MSVPLPVTLKTWDEIQKEFDRFPRRHIDFDSEGDLERSGWVFRGHQTEEYELSPSIERVSSSGHTSWLASEFVTLGEFQGKARMYTDVSGVESEPEWLARLNWLSLMQHYGIPTRLLDFTHSPYVALYFALRHNPERCKAAEIWAIDAEALTQAARNLSLDADKEEYSHWGEWHKKGRVTVPGPGPTANWSEPTPRLKPPVLSINPIMFADTRDQLESDRREWLTALARALTPDCVRRAHFNKTGFVGLAEPTLQNRRLSSQQGLFLFNGAVELSFKESLFKMMDGRGADWCKRFRVPVCLRDDIERNLFRMNVHDLSLFPDIEGLAGFIRQETRLHWFPVAQERTKCYPILIEPSESGYFAHSPDAPGCSARGGTPNEARLGFKGALVNHFAALRAAKKAIPQPASVISYVEIPE
jgi:predicted RNase H-like HicB family nuclease